MTLRLALLPFFIFYSLYSLEINIDSGRENNKPFSIITMEDENPFICEALKDDFHEVKKIICGFERTPKERFKKINNNFFTISSQIKENKYFLIITPHNKMELIPTIFNLANEKTTYETDVKFSRRWSIIGYIDELPFMKKSIREPQGINFPVTMDGLELPYIGGLDLKGDPIHISESKDVSEYMNIKQFYENKKYDRVLDLIEDVLNEYPETIFKSELLVYKLRSMHVQEDWLAIIPEAKAFLRDFSGDENSAEVLAYLAKSYAKLGQIGDGDYFFDRLFNEHEDNYFAHLGMIFKADQLMESGNFKKAIAFYEKAYLETKDLSLAARAAYSMIRYYIDREDYVKAAEYADKILAGKREYFFEQKDESIKMCDDFVHHEDYKSASNILESILEGLTEGTEEHQELLRSLALWLAQTENKEKALSVCDKYLQEYAYGMYREEISKARDGLFFESKDINFSEKLANYESLIEKYKDDSIGNKAIYKKAKLFYDNRNYKDVLDMKPSLILLDKSEYQVDQLIVDSAIGEMKNLLQSKNCNGVVALSRAYDVNLSNEWDMQLYECGIEGADYALAKNMTQKHLKDENLQERSSWLLRNLKVDYRLGKYKDVIKASKDIYELSSEDYKKALRDVFDSYQRLDDLDGMIKIMSEIETYLELDYLDIERVAQMVSVAIKKKDTPMVINYGKKVMELQNRTKTYHQSPYIEFSLTQALMDLKRDQEALDVILTLDLRELSQSKRSRALYQKGALYQILGDDEKAKDSYNKSIEADAISPWGKLSTDALKFIK